VEAAADAQAALAVARALGAHGYAATAHSVLRPVTGWHSLTDTEQAVAGLVAQGLNNNQVAARMYISTHTVAHHLRQAFRKLSIASRYELTRIAIEQAADSPTRLATLTMWAARDTTILGHAAGASGA